MEGGIGLLLLSRVGTDSRIRGAGFSLPRRLFRHPADSPFAFRRPPPPAKLISSNGWPPTDYALFQLEHDGNSIIFENFWRDFSRVWIVYSGGGKGKEGFIYLISDNFRFERGWNRGWNEILPGNFIHRWVITWEFQHVRYSLACKKRVNLTMLFQYV